MENTTITLRGEVSLQEVRELKQAVIAAAVLQDAGRRTSWSGEVTPEGIRSALKSYLLALQAVQADTP